MSLYQIFRALFLSLSMFLLLSPAASEEPMSTLSLSVVRLERALHDTTTLYCRMNNEL